jgi:hypothetical protein
MNYKIYSFFNTDLNPDIGIYQKKVFDKFRIPLEQVAWIKDFKKYPPVTLDDGTIYYNDHPHFLNNILINDTTDYIIFFDVDCIPLSYNFLDRLLHEISDNNTVSGAGQNNCYGTYMSAWFIGFYRNLFFECGSPPITNRDTDPFLCFTQECIKRDKQIKYWAQTHIERPPFGTIYENLIYHEMQIRHAENQDHFINKCKSLL